MSGGDGVVCMKTDGQWLLFWKIGKLFQVLVCCLAVCGRWLTMNYEGRIITNTSGDRGITSKAEVAWGGSE